MADKQKQYYTQTAAAERCGISVPTLNKRIKELGIDPKKLDLNTIRVINANKKQKEDIDIVNNVVNKAKKLGIPTQTLVRGEQVSPKATYDELLRELTNRQLLNGDKLEQMNEYLDECYLKNGRYTLLNAQGTPMANPEMKMYTDLGNEQNKLSKLIAEVLSIAPPQETNAPEIVM